MIHVHLPIRTVSEPNARGHWARRYRRTATQRGVTDLALRAPAAELLERESTLLVLLTRIGPSNGLDDDNLAGALKSVRDGVADALGIDDRDPRVTWMYAQRRGKVWGVDVRVGTPAEIRTWIDAAVRGGVRAAKGSA